MSCQLREGDVVAEPLVGELVRRPSRCRPSRGGQKSFEYTGRVWVSRAKNESSWSSTMAPTVENGYGPNAAPSTSRISPCRARGRDRRARTASVTVGVDRVIDGKPVSVRHLWTSQ